MSIKRTEVENQNESKCKECMVFYASEAYKGYCSSCFKYFIILCRKNKVNQ